MDYRKGVVAPYFLGIQKRGEAEHMRLLAPFAGQRFFLLQMLQDKHSLNRL